MFRVGQCLWLMTNCFLALTEHDPWTAALLLLLLLTSSVLIARFKNMQHPGSMNPIILHCCWSMLIGVLQLKKLLAVRSLLLLFPWSVAPSLGHFHVAFYSVLHKIYVATEVICFQVACKHPCVTFQMSLPQKIHV